jgi:ADP-ribosylglycohydrolase
MLTYTGMPADYLEHVYAGVLGKLIGVYLGRPFEGWSHSAILAELGDIRHYVHTHFPGFSQRPPVVTDDDVSGTFTFIQALAEHGITRHITSEQVGNTWLNNVIERETVFWWGGRGISTEHTAFLNLKKGIKAPDSGSAKVNGKTVAEQVGAQIFIDGWAMLCPGQPELAARLAKEAGAVSHDGESILAAMMWAAMEAEAFLSHDVGHLIETGLNIIRKERRGSLIEALIQDVRQWVALDKAWRVTRQRIDDKYGYDHFEGIVHVVPNHAVMVMALLYSGNDFHEAMHIVNTCGWDTDCNSGNLACLIAIMQGLECFEGGPDWRGPIADRALISSANGGYSVNNAARLAYDIANLGRRLAGHKPLPLPKDGAQYHFTLPGSVQGFTVYPCKAATMAQSSDRLGRPGLAINLTGLTPTSDPVAAMTDTFHPLYLPTSGETYPLTSTPLLYPGQTVRAVLRADADECRFPVSCQIIIKAYDHDDTVLTFKGPATDLHPAVMTGDLESPPLSLEYRIPTSGLLDGTRPIFAVGVALTPVLHPYKAPGSAAAAAARAVGTVRLDRLSWDGSPRLDLKLPRHTEEPLTYFRRMFICSVDDMHMSTGPAFRLAQDSDEGLLSIGTREWARYTVRANGFRVLVGGPCGVVVRVQGLRRWYGVVLVRCQPWPHAAGEADGRTGVAIVKAFDGQRTALGYQPMDWDLDVPFDIVVTCHGRNIEAKVYRSGETGSEVLVAVKDDEGGAYQSGGVGFVIYEGAVAVEELAIRGEQ